MTVRKKVTDEDFNRAHRGVPGDEVSIKAASDNRNVVCAVLKKYAGLIPSEELKRCGLHALWRCLQYHDDSYGQKFTTSLHRFTVWECKRELRRHSGKRKGHPNMHLLPLFDDCIDHAAAETAERNEKLAHIKECLGMLPEPWQRQVLIQYYFEGLTMDQVGKRNGYSKEAARQKVGRALSALKEICGVLAG